MSVVLTIIGLLIAAACLAFCAYHNAIAGVGGGAKPPAAVTACIVSLDANTQPWPKVRVLLGALRAKGFLLAMVTDASAQSFERQMAALPEVLALLDASVTRDDVERGKPAPDLYLEAARRLRVDPSRCLAFDETAAGIDGAQAAKMYTAALGPAVDARVGQPNPDWVLRDVGGFDLRDIALASSDLAVDRYARAASDEPLPLAPPEQSWLAALLPTRALAVCLAGPASRHEATGGYTRAGNV